MPRPARSHHSNPSRRRASKTETITLRVIAGHLRSRKIHFEYDQRTRPMKDRTREAVMNLLGGTLEGSIAFDLFGGSGILAFEAISRGSDLAIVWEILKFGAVRIEAFAKELGIEDQVRVVSADVFRWSADWESVFPTLSIPEKCPWLVFCCPPYALWESNGMELKELIQQWITAAPPGSLFAIELEQNTPDAMLPESLEWDLRRYAPAKIAIGQTS